MAWRGGAWQTTARISGSLSTPSFHNNDLPEPLVARFARSVHDAIVRALRDEVLAELLEAEREADRQGLSWYYCCHDQALVVRRRGQLTWLVVLRDGVWGDHGPTRACTCSVDLKRKIVDSHFDCRCSLHWVAMCRGIWFLW